MQYISSSNESFNEGKASVLLESRIETLRTLTSLLVRELASLERVMPSPDAGILTGENFSLQDEVHRYEIDLIKSALFKTGGRQRQAARLLGMKVTTLNAKIKKHDIDWKVVGVEGEYLS